MADRKKCHKKLSSCSGSAATYLCSPQQIIYTLQTCISSSVKLIVWSRHSVLKLYLWNIIKSLRMTKPPFFLFSPAVCHQNYLTHKSKYLQNYSRIVIKTIYFLTHKSFFLLNTFLIYFFSGHILVSKYNTAQKSWLEFNTSCHSFSYLKSQSCLHHNWFL